MPTAFENAQELSAWGFNVLPARGKAPAVSWADFQHQRSDSKLKAWFGNDRGLNYWTNCGSISGWLCLDCDSEVADRHWREVLGDEVLDNTPCVKTSKGYHYWFRIPDGMLIRSWSQNDAQKAAGILFDVRAEGTGAILPPSVHESGHVYEWVRSPAGNVEEVPEALFGPQTTSEDDGAVQGRSMMSQLLDNPPDGEGGRNNWLARVAGFAAKHFPFRDGYESLVRMAADKLDPPLPEKEIAKLLDSIWAKEQRKGSPEGHQATIDNGDLIPGDHSLLTEVIRGKGKDADVVLEEWADFDIRALGVVEDEDARRFYDVEVYRKRKKDKLRRTLPAKALADLKAMNAWLIELGVTIMPPQNQVSKGAATARLARYLEAQDPPHFKIVPALGWYDGEGFVCHEGVIDHDGLRPHAEHKPDPKLRNWAPYRYGFEIGEAEASRMLAEVLTFHDPTVTAVFGGWWAACMFKAQMAHLGALAQFPFMALEAPSESGKTTGFFSLMIALNGNTQGQTAATAAALRDYISAHQSGIVWVDDLDSTEHLMELLRSATGGGSVAKKGEDNTGQANVHLVAPISISGETLQLHGQKALLDRAVTLHVPNPTNRRSVHDPNRYQWDDIVAFKQRYPDLSKAAGTLVQMAYQHLDLIGQLPSLRIEKGRFGDKLAVVRMGARLLARLSGNEEVVDLADAWAAEQVSVGNENTLTLKLMPKAFAANGMPTKPDAHNGRWPSTPVFYAEGHVWFSPASLARWWFEMQHGRVEQRTESEEALTQQARALGLGGNKGDQWNDGVLKRKRFNLGGDPNNKQWYWSCDPEITTLVRRRAAGVPEDPAGQSTPIQGVMVTDDRTLQWTATFPDELDPEV